MPPECTGPKLTFPALLMGLSIISTRPVTILHEPEPFGGA